MIVGTKITPHNETAAPLQLNVRHNPFKTWTWILGDSCRFTDTLTVYIIVQGKQDFLIWRITADVQTQHHNMQALYRLSYVDLKLTFLNLFNQRNKS